MNLKTKITQMLDGEFPEIRKFYKEKVKEDPFYYGGEFKFLITAIEELVKEEIENKLPG